MKIFLFLYPVREYLTEGLVGMSRRRFPERGLRVERLSEIINIRYRQQGYHVFWLLFGNKENNQMPDVSRISSDIQFDVLDRILSCGVSFQGHVTSKIYPDPCFVLRQLPDDISHLVLGGFHQWDCVDKLAAVAYQQGIDTLVDEDTTEMFFIRTSLFGPIPLMRTSDDYVQAVVRGHEDEPWILEMKRERRKERPWFVQI